MKRVTKTDRQHFRNGLVDVLLPCVKKNCRIDVPEIRRKQRCQDRRKEYPHRFQRKRGRRRLMSEQKIQYRLEHKQGEDKQPVNELNVDARPKQKNRREAIKSSKFIFRQRGKQKVSL